MATQEIFGRATQAEIASLNAFIPSLEQLLSGIHNFDGILSQTQFSNKIDGAVAIIDDLNTSLKPLLQQIKIDINA